MESFARKTGNDHYDWYGFFKKATQFSLSQQDIDTAISRASRWDTCALSEQCNIVPRHEKTGMPKDMYLCSLGFRFMDEIRKGLFFSAQTTLARIELRSAQIILHLKHECSKNTELQNYS